MTDICGFDEAWNGPCHYTTHCVKHPPRECKGCGKPAVQSFDHTGIQFVCGVPLCSDCRHCPPPAEGSNWFGLAGEHKPSAVANSEWKRFYKQIEGEP